MTVVPSFAIGVMAYNEGRNLGRLLERLRSLAPDGARLLRVVVVASGCSDDTVAVARRAAAADPRVCVVVEPERRGKAAAINRFIETSPDADILVLESADTLPEGGAVEAMLARFADPAIGMVGSRPVPEDDETTFLGYANQLLWRLHHAVASRSPKQGELVAWRNVVDALPATAVMDEAYLEAALTRRGLRLAYAPEAVVRNRGAATVGAFLMQRRRNHAGHRILESAEGYRPATRDHLLLARLALAEWVRHPGRTHWIVAAAAIELWAAVLGWWDHAVAGRSHALWTVIDGTKELAASTAEAHPAVTAVVVPSAGAEALRACLRSLGRSRYSKLRVLVVDAAFPSVVPAVRAEYPAAEILPADRRAPRAAWLNAAARAALGAGCEHLIVLDDTVVLSSDFIERAIASALAEPRAATVSGPVFYDDDPERLHYAGGEILWWLGKTYHRGRRVLWGPAFAGERRVGYASPGVALYRAAALRQVGGWDETYFRLFEEPDWCARARRHGWWQLYADGPRAWQRSDPLESRSPAYRYFLLRNTVLFMRRHARWWHWPTFVMFFAAESLGRSFLSGLFSPGAGRTWRATWLSVRDALRGRSGRGSADRLLADPPLARAEPLQ
ncbi:MAG: glycosyltransferase, partial [Candidatus Limnocylindria bacterium]